MNGKISVGDLLAPTVEGLSNERFYVLKVGENDVTLLAERNINISTNAQVDGRNEVAYDDSSNNYYYSDI